MSLQIKFFTNQRSNPSTTWKGRDVHPLSSSEKRQLAQSLHTLGTTVWTAVAQNDGVAASSMLASNYQEILEILNSPREVILCVAYAPGTDPMKGPYLSYLLGYEIDPSDEYDEDVEYFEDVTGKDFSTFVSKVPSGKVFYFFDMTRDITNPKSKIVHKEIWTAFLEYMISEGHGFVAHMREKSTYRIYQNHPMKSRITVVLDELERNYLGPGEHVHAMYGFFKK